MEEPKNLVSACCKWSMIPPPDEDMAESMGSLQCAYDCFICRKCGKACQTENNPEEWAKHQKSFSPGDICVWSGSVPAIVRIEKKLYDMPGGISDGCYTTGSNDYNSLHPEYLRLATEEEKARLPEGAPWIKI